MELTFHQRNSNALDCHFDRNAVEWRNLLTEHPDVWVTVCHSDRSVSEVEESLTTSEGRIILKS